MNNNQQPGSEQDKPDWVGRRAVAWVIDEAPVPVDLAWTLVVIARRAGEDGTGSFQSVSTMVKRTGKSREQVQRDVARLLELGLIKLGDQSIPEQRGIPAGKRPMVYDLVLDMRGPKPSRKSKNPTGKKKPESATSGMDARGGMDAARGMHAAGRGGMDAAPRGGMDATQIKPLNKTLNNPPSLSSNHPSEPASTRSGEQDRERGRATSTSTTQRTDPRVRHVVKHGAPQPLAEKVVAWIELDSPVDIGVGWYVNLSKSGDLAIHVGNALKALERCEHCGDTGQLLNLEALAAGTSAYCPVCVPPEETNVPPWCGHCDSADTRIVVEVDHGHEVLTACPRCHPRAVGFLRG